MKNAPKIKITPIKEKSDAKPFIKLHHTLCKIEYPDGTSAEMILDTVTRRGVDASVIIPYTSINGELHVWLRSAIRPAASLRHHTDPDYIYDGNFWELPAGLIDAGETPAEAAKRECMEEIGFNYPVENFNYAGIILSMPSLISERLYFFSVLVDNETQEEPTLDGSRLEYGGELTCVKLTELMQLLKQDKIIDMKTNLGLRMLQEKIKPSWSV